MFAYKSALATTPSTTIQLLTFPVFFCRLSLAHDDILVRHRVGMQPALETRTESCRCVAAGNHLGDIVPCCWVNECDSHAGRAVRRVARRAREGVVGSVVAADEAVHHACDRTTARRRWRRRHAAAGGGRTMARYRGQQTDCTHRHTPQEERSARTAATGSKAQCHRQEKQSCWRPDKKHALCATSAHDSSPATTNRSGRDRSSGPAPPSAPPLLSGMLIAAGIPKPPIAVVLHVVFSCLRRAFVAPRGDGVPYVHACVASDATGLVGPRAAGPRRRPPPGITITPSIQFHHIGSL